MNNRPGFEIKDQLIALVRLIVHLASAALLLVLGSGFRWLVGWASQGLPASEHVERLVGGTAAIAVVVVALGVTVAGLWVFISDTYADLRLRHRYNVELMKEDGLREDADAR